MDSVNLLLLLLSFILFTDQHSVSGTTYDLVRTPFTPTPGINIPDENGFQSYIVHVKSPENIPFSHSGGKSWQSSLLESAVSSAAPRFIYSYNTVMTGFAARLTKEELEVISKMDWFVHAYPDKIYKPVTTRTPEFLGLNLGSGLWNVSNLGAGVIIGMIDVGIYPNHPSFDGTGMPPPPAKWKGHCDFNTTCNNKLIGVRTFVKMQTSARGMTMYETPIDEEGHGTHTASTAAGQFIEHADLLGNAKGRAAGIAPRAHVASYKVCGAHCSGADILRGINAAVDDGVDVLSMSLGSDGGPLYNDPVAVGTFGAMEKGIFASCAAGNDGPHRSSVSNDAPWILTVGASTLDRLISVTVKLGNGVQFTGESLYQPSDFKSQMLPLVYTGSRCSSLQGLDVKGKIVLCARGSLDITDKGKNVKAAGGAGMIVFNEAKQGATTIASPHVLPAANVGFSAKDKIMAYIHSTVNPTATFTFDGTITGSKVRAPQLGSFSSRGPSKNTPGILKPDITGPGVNILAAYPFLVHPNATFPAFGMLWGTSMSCPHLSGVAALLKSSHPDWSPAMIKSAMMTTTDIVDNTGNPIIDEIDEQPASLFALGAGHVNPTKANDPGLVYDIEPDEYVRFLCGLPSIGSVHIKDILRRPTACSANITEDELNYPSITVPFTADIHTVSLKRTATSVTDGKAVYLPKFDLPANVSVAVKPSRLVFSKVNEKKTFELVFTTTNIYTSAAGSRPHSAEGQLKWVSAKHVVRSPISITFH